MGKCQSQESARDCAPDQLPVIDEPVATSVSKAEESVAPLAGSAAMRSCITKQTLSEMPADSVDLDEEEQVNAFSKLLVKNLLVQECAVADQEEKDEEIEVKAQAMTVLVKVIQQECQKMDDEEAVLEHEKVAEESKPSGEEVLSNDQNVVEDKVEEVALKNIENVTEAKVSNADALVKNDETVAIPCTKCKGTGKTNKMGGTRGFSFMKSRFTQCSSETQVLAAKAGA